MDNEEKKHHEDQIVKAIQTELVRMVTSVERVSVQGIPHLLCEAPQIFSTESLFGLKVGDKIKQIGKPKVTAKNKSGETSSNRVDHFETPLEYAGTTVQSLYENMENPRKALAFRIQAPDVTGLVEGQYLYILYFLGVDELIQSNLTLIKVQFGCINYTLKRRKANDELQYK